MDKRKRKYQTSYSNISQREAELSLNIRFSKLLSEAINASDMIKNIKEVAPSELKDLVFSRLVDALESEGYPEASIEPFKEIVVHDFIGDILRTIVAYFKRKTNNKDIIITREKEILSKDREIGGNMEFVIIDTISVIKDRYLIIVEAKRDALGKGLTQCLLSMRDRYNLNEDNQLIYGFVTTGIDWQLIIYNGDFKISNKLTLITADMGNNKEEWIRNYSQLIDIIYKLLLYTSTN